MARDDDREHDELVSISAPGADEVSILAWPLLFRQRFIARVERSSKYPWLVLVAALYGLFATGFTITILAVSLPTIADDLGSSTTTLTWVITGPLLAFGVVGPAAGKAGDLFGQKRVYLLGLFLSGVLALGIAFSWNATSLIAFRVLAAAAGAASGPASMAMINQVFPRERRVQAMGYWSMIGAGAPVLGVVAGGPIVEAISWRVIFLMQAPLVFFGVALSALILPETVRKRGIKLDVVGAALLAVGVTGLLLALNRGPVLGWDSPLVIGGFIASPIVLLSFWKWEQRVPQPLVRLEYLRRRNVAAPVATQTFTNFAYMGGFIITPLLLSEVFDYGPSRVGLLSIARPLTFAVAAPLGGRLALKVGERSMGVAGAAAVVLSMLALAQVTTSSSDLIVIGSLALSGVGLGVSSPSMAATIANDVDQDDLGIAGAVQQMLTQVGVVAGIQLMQTLQVAVEDSRGLVGSYQAAYYLGAAVCCLGVLTAAFVRRSRPDDEHRYADPSLDLAS